MHRERWPVLRPLKVVIDNYPENQVEEMGCGQQSRRRKLQAPIKFHFPPCSISSAMIFVKILPQAGITGCRLGREVRLRYGYLITCTSVVKNDAGEAVEVHCTYDPATRGGNTPDGRKVKSTIHWVSAANAVDAEVRIYENLFTKENPDEAEEGDDFISNLNRNSLEVVAAAKVEPSLANVSAGTRYQFERLGYFCVDPDSKPGKPVFNRTVALKDTWAKVEKKQGK